MKYSILLFLGLFFCATYAPIYTDATLTGDGTTDTPLGVNRGSEITPDTLKADQDDYDPTSWDAASNVRLISDRILAITSFAPPDASSSPQEKTLWNVGLYMIYFPMDHPDGTAANRLTGLGKDFYLHPGRSCKIYYDGTSSRWRVLGDDLGGTGVFYEWSPGSITLGDYSEFGFAAISGGAQSSVSSTTLPGANRFTSNASSTGGFVGYFNKTSSEFTSFGAAHIFIESLISIPTLSDGSETFTVEIQLAESPSGTTLEVNNTIGLRYSSGINSGEWELFSQDNAGAESVADCNVSVAAATLYRLRIEHNKSNTEARAYINGNYVGSVTGSMPNGVEIGAKVILVKSVGTTARTLNVHNLSTGAIYQ